MKKTDLNRTLTQLDGKDWGEPPADATQYMMSCYEVRRKPLKNFTADDFRIAIGQDMGLHSLLPLALDVLYEDPCVEAKHYPGDLLCNVLRADKTFYAANPKVKERVQLVLVEVEKAMKYLDESDATVLRRALVEPLKQFAAI